MATINDLPFEILEKIFLYVDCKPKDFLNLTVVSRKFNRVIGTSPKLMDHYVLNWTGNKDNQVLISSSRTYRNLKVTNESGLSVNFQQFLKWSTNLTSLSFSSCILKSSHIQMLLEICGNLVQFELVDIIVRSNYIIQPLKLPNLEVLELTLNPEINFMSIFNAFSKAPNVKKFKCCGKVNMINKDVPYFWEILGNWKRLTDLTFSYNVIHIIFTLEDFSIVKFNLVFFQILENLGYTQFFDNGENLVRFLQMQASSLNCVVLTNVTVTALLLQTILKMKKLLTASLEKITFNIVDNHQQDYVENHSILELDIATDHFPIVNHEVMLVNFLRKCMKVRKLNFQKIDMTFDICHTLAHYVPNLESLKVYSCKLTHMTMPRLKTLQVMGSHEGLIRMIRCNRQLVRLVVPESIRNIRSFVDAVAETNVEELDFV